MRPISIQTRLRLALLLIALVMFIGAAGFHFVEGWSWFDGIYMTIITMTTVGYGEIHPLSPSGRVFNTFLILASVIDRKSTRLNSSHIQKSRMPSSA